MNIKKISSSILLLGFFAFSFAQEKDDLMKSLDSANGDQKITVDASNAFKALQVVNMQSTKTPAKKEFYLIVSHRFGALGGEGVNFFDNFFGFDKATTKLGMIYGVNDWLSFGASRLTPKLYEATAKYRIIKQKEKGSPVTLVGFNTINMDTSLKQAVYPNIMFKDKLSFSNQLLISRKLNDRFSLELAGIWVHKNLIDPTMESKDMQIISGGGRVKISKRMSINGEYGFRLNPVSSSTYKNPVSVGLDIDTGGHIFQLVFSNSQRMNDVGYFTNTSGDISKGGVFFGFNMYRVF